MHLHNLALTYLIVLIQLSVVYAGTRGGFGGGAACVYLSADRKLVQPQADDSVRLVAAPGVAARLAANVAHLANVDDIAKGGFHDSPSRQRRHTRCWPTSNSSATFCPQASQRPSRAAVACMISVRRRDMASDCIAAVEVARRVSAAGRRTADSARCIAPQLNFNAAPPDQAATSAGPRAASGGRGGSGGSR